MMVTPQPAQQTSKKIGIREFRDNIARFVESQDPIAITKHGETVGYYIPTRPKPTQNDVDNLKTATDKIQALLERAGVTEDDLLNDFKALRREDQH